MNIPTTLPRLKGFRFSREIIAWAVWAYHRFALSTADVEDLLAARGVIVSRETVRLWVNRFGRHFADCIRRDRPSPNDKWHMDEVVIMIRGKKHWLWRAIDANGDVLDILVQSRRNAKAARRFFQRLTERFGEPRVVITDKLPSYIKPIKSLAPKADHRAHKGLNNVIEVSHRSTRKREKYWAGSNLTGKLRGFCLRTIRSTWFSAPPVINSTQLHTATPVPMHSAYGPATPQKWWRDPAAANEALSAANNLAIPLLRILEFDVCTIDSNLIFDLVINHVLAIS